MAQGPLHNVSFQAARTNSSQPSPPVLPYHIDQALHGKVGTIRPPFELSRVSRFLGLFITFLVFFGILWVLRQTPIVAFILATVVACISLSMSGLFFGIPYLKQRRSDWTAANWWLLNTAIFVVWAAGFGVLQQLVYHPPKIAWKSMLSPLMDNTRRIEEIKSQLWTARYDCNYRGCAEWRHELEGKLAKAQAPKNDWSPLGEGEPVDEGLLLVALSIVLGVAVGIAAYGRPLASEATNAIWREPYTGYPTGDNTPPPKPTTPEDDEGKNKVFRDWVIACVKTTAEAEPSIKVDEAYTKYSKFCEQYPSKPLDLVPFKAKMKSELGKEPVGDRYQGVFISDGAIA